MIAFWRGDVATDAEVGERLASGRVEGVERPVGRDVVEAEGAQHAERRKVGGLPFVDAVVHHVLDGGAQRAEVAFAREDRQGEAYRWHWRACFIGDRAKLGAARGEGRFHVLAARMADGEDYFVKV